jgi:hypothetical protein
VPGVVNEALELPVIVLSALTGTQPGPCLVVCDASVLLAGTDPAVTCIPPLLPPGFVAGTLLLVPTEQTGGLRLQAGM